LRFRSAIRRYPRDRRHELISPPRDGPDDGLPAHDRFGRGLRRLRRHRGVEEITTARHCLDQAAIDVAELLAQFADALHKRVIAHADIGPHGLEKLWLGDEQPSVLRKIAQHLERLGPQVDFLIAGAQTSACQIERKAVKPQHRVVHSAAPERAIIG
jgi:hypothetical protein